MLDKRECVNYIRLV